MDTECFPTREKGAFSSTRVVYGILLVVVSRSAARETPVKAAQTGHESQSERSAAEGTDEP
jgi:hypothetical protein